MIQPAGGRKKITVYYYNSFRKSRYLVQKTLVSVDGMGDSDGDDGSSFGSIETVTDSEQEANAAALLTTAVGDFSWTFFARWRGRGGVTSRALQKLHVDRGIPLLVGGRSHSGDR